MDRRLPQIRGKLEQEKVINLLKQTLEDLRVNVYKTTLFGSRARGDYTSDSDYDFLIIVENPISTSEKRRIASFIRRRMAENNIPVDVFLKDMRDYESYKDVVGSLSYEVGKEGIVV